MDPHARGRGGSSFPIPRLTQLDGIGQLQLASGAAVETGPAESDEQAGRDGAGWRSPWLLYATGILPPSITYSVPVMVDARADARNTMRLATSIGFEGRPSGIPPSEFMIICLPPS